MERRRSSVINTTLPPGAGDDIMRTISRTFSGGSRVDEEIAQYDGADASADSDSAKTKVEDWKLADDVKEIQKNDPADGRKLGVTWSGLTVQVVPSDAQLQENVISQFNIPQQIKESRQRPELKTILDSSFGSVRPGEMLLVLGRPGSGCTTLLKMLANKRKGCVVILRKSLLELG
jgi:ABC-type glutathione transport system ATPase component